MMKSTMNPGPITLDVVGLELNARRLTQDQRHPK